VSPGFSHKQAEEDEVKTDRERRCALVRALDCGVTVLAALMIPVVILEDVATTPDLLLLAEVANWIIWLGFVTELGVKLALSSDRLRTLRECWLELAIVLLTPPFISRLEPLSPLRTVRAFRILRFLRFVRLGLAGLEILRRLRYLLGRHRFAYVLCAMVLVVLLGGIMLFLLEADLGTVHDLGDALWWAVVTVTTVGYGDITPKTAMGRLVALVVMLVGISFVSILTANIAAYFLEARQDTAEAAIRERLSAVEAGLNELSQALQQHTIALRESSGRTSEEAREAEHPRVAESITGSAERSTDLA
jgi:voltage-gated potassium channel